jgi:hypothetical protein
MATESPNAPRPRVAPRTYPPGYKPGADYGWVKFAGTMLLIIGAVNCIGGIAAIDGSRFFAGAASFITGDLESLGWVVLVVGLVQLLAGVGIWSKAFWSVWLGLLAAGVNAIAQLLFLPAQPFWSLAVFAIDVLVMHALIMYAEPD